MTYKLFAVSAPGLEQITRLELEQLGYQTKPVQINPAGAHQEEVGGVEFEARPADLYRANLLLRTASRIISRLGSFDAVGFDELRKKASRLGWREFIRPGQPVAIRVTCKKSRLYHSDAVGREIAKAISSAVQGDITPVKPDADAEQPAQLIIVRLNNDVCTISVDTSGALLHRRGYRLQTAKAPIRETLAAGMLLASGWDGTSPLMDPFCGSGTIPIEAALLASKIAPGKNRRFAFMNWPNYKKSLWQEQLDAAQAMEVKTLPEIFGSDRDEGAIQISKENARRAGMEDLIRFNHLAVSAVEPTARIGWMVSNPPYGVRVSPESDLRNLYSRLGDLLREKFPGWHYAILNSEPVLMGHLHLKHETILPLVNGGIPVKLYCGTIRG